MLVVPNDLEPLYDYDALIACGEGRLWRGGPRLPLPPMLMFDEITEINEGGGEFKKGLVCAKLNITPELWFFGCHFKGDPVMPGCLIIDALWQLAGAYLGHVGTRGMGRALGMDKVKNSGQVRPTGKVLRYEVHVRSVRGMGTGKLILADGRAMRDGTDVCAIENMKVFVGPVAD